MSQIPQDLADAVIKQRGRKIKAACRAEGIDPRDITFRPGGAAAFRGVVPEHELQVRTAAATRVALKVRRILDAERAIVRRLHAQVVTPRRGQQRATRSRRPGAMTRRAAVRGASRGDPSRQGDPEPPPPAVAGAPRAAVIGGRP